MTRRPLSYDNLTIDEEPPTPESTAPATVAAPAPPESLRNAADSELLRDVAHQTMLYLHVEGVRAIDEYALAQSALHKKVKRHDLILEAIEEWAERRGIKATFRAKERKFKARRKYVIVSE